MTEAGRDKIAFHVQTDRVLQILTSEIYDSPKAFLRENVQNAYDAILMRCTEQGLSPTERRIDVTIESDRITVVDDGIGMTEDVLRNNFWKAGSSGKKTELAQRSGVIGTFGIGAMANFGVCTKLVVETRSINSDVALVSSAKRSELRIGDDCIDLERVNADDRSTGTTVRATIDGSFTIDAAAAAKYLAQYVRFVPVPVFVNGQLISQQTFDASISNRSEGFSPLSAPRVVTGDGFQGTIQNSVNSQARVMSVLNDISLNGAPLAGRVVLLQEGGQTMGYRNRFGLAPIPVSGTYALGGFVDLSILHPTAGREALSRESIQHVAHLVTLVESEVTKDLAETSAADENQQFQQYILSQGLLPLAKNVTISVLPARINVPLGKAKDFEPGKNKHFYSGQDATVMKTFATEEANLFHPSQSSPRRKLQLQFLRTIAGLEEVPEHTIVDLVPPTELSLDEAMFLIHLRDVLSEHYFLPEVDARLATISHGVSIQVAKKERAIEILISRTMPALRVVVEAYRAAKEVFHQFVVDFVREHLYQHLREHVPSSTRQGRDALYRRLKENEELFRYELSDFGDIESLLADYLAGKAELEEVLRSSGGSGGGHRQEVRKEQVGTVEAELPGIVDDPDESAAASEHEAVPPILRLDLVSEMKVLTVAAPHAKLNNFQIFLSLADRLVRAEGEFLRVPHTTKVIWGSHRVIYVFTDATAELSLYYDIKLKEPLESNTTGGALFPTTTIVTKSKIFVPVPKVLESAFRITDGAKEFFVRFDTIP